MRVIPSLILVAAVALIFGLAGAGIAAILARLLPGYYAMVFPQAIRSGLDPAELGIALGFTQGIMAGIVVSLAVLGLAAWRSHRSRLQASLNELSDRLDELQLAVRQLRQEWQSRQAAGERETAKRGDDA